MRFAKIFFWMSFSVVICGSIAGLFFYANLMPLHVDEAGYWFNFTNKALPIAPCQIHKYQTTPYQFILQNYLSYGLVTTELAGVFPL